MKKWHFFLAGLALMAACTEKTDLRSDGEYNEYLVVDATLTDQAGVPQQVMLSRTVPYFSDGQEQAAAAVRGASVTVADEEETVRFSEQQPGVYVAPEGYHAEYGRNYRLRIEEGGNIYEAEATMPESGFRLDEIDYAWAGNKSMGVDSLWTVTIWGILSSSRLLFEKTVAASSVWRSTSMAKSSRAGPESVSFLDTVT